MGTNSELAKQPLSLPRGMRKIHPYQGSPKIHELESKQEQIVPSLSCTWGEKGTEEILSTSNVRAPFLRASPVGPSESLDGTGKIRGMKEVVWCLTSVETLSKTSL